MSPNIGYHLGLKCVFCDESYEFDLWVIIDVQERPDLLERMMKEDLHEARCPRCGHPQRLNADLLIYRPQQQPVLLFSPCDQGSMEERRTRLFGLLNMLKKQLGETWQEDWLCDGVIGVARSHLATSIQKESDYFQKQPFTDVKSVQLLDKLLQAPQWEGTREIISCHPELISDKFESFLEEMIDKFQQLNNPEHKKILDEYLRLLRRCRQIGIDNAVAEKYL
jgi:hypothetical protein